MMKSGIFFISVVFLFSCEGLKQQKKDEYEMRKSYNNFIFSVDELDHDGLQISALFPGVEDYRAHVKSLLVHYMDTVKTEKLVFDDVGVVLTRYLGLTYHKYVLKEIDIDRQVGIAHLRVSIHFGYENNIKATQPEQGITYFIPTEPWGRSSKVTIGKNNKVPRKDLLYIEYDVVMVATEYEGYWRVSQTVVDESSLKFRDSYESFE